MESSAQSEDNNVLMLANGNTNQELDTEAIGANDLPILDEYALEHLFSRFSIYQLAKCRLVCKLWNQISLRIIPRKAHYLSIVHWRKAVHHPTMPKQDIGSPEDIPELIALIKNSKQFPWTRFKIDSQLVANQEDEEEFHKLFKEIAPIATKLWIFALKSRLFSDDTIEYPVLKTFYLHYRDPSYVDYLPLRRTVDFALNIVNKAPNLTTLCLNGNQTMEYFMQILQTENGKKVTKLLISSLIKNEHLNRLTTFGLQLEHLSLKFAGAGITLLDERMEISSRQMLSFLASQKSTLEKLQIGEVKEDQNLTMNVRFPKMEKLKILKIALPCQCWGVNYLEQFPVLKKLEFWLYDPEMTTFASFFNSKMQPVDTVEELNFSSEMKDAEIILHAGRQFPKLRKLSVNANLSLLNCVGRSMSNLEELRLLCEGKEDLDAIFAGVSTIRCNQMKVDWGLKADCSPDALEPIRCLQGLRKLELVKDPEELEFVLSDFGCRVALLKLERLHTLEFVGEYKSQISDEMFAILKNKFTVLV